MPPRHFSRLSDIPALTCLLAALLVLAGPLGYPPAAPDAKNPTHPFPGNEKADIWVLAGQSNMGGSGLLKAPVETDPRVMEFKNPKWVTAENPMHTNFVSPSWDPKGKDSVRDNILLQRDHVRMPEGMTPEDWVRKVEARGDKLGGVGPGLFFAKSLTRAMDHPVALVSWSYGGYQSADSFSPGRKTPREVNAFGEGLPLRCD